MTLETETSPPARGSSVEDNNSKTALIQYTMSESNNSNGGQGRYRGGNGGRGVYQVHDGRRGRFNQMPDTSLIRKFKGKVEYFGAVLGTTAEQKESKLQFNKLDKNMKNTY